MKLIFHIGAGKTGSSSIQKTLAGAESQLISHGICYVGLMFEKNVPKIYDWQESSQIEQFHALPSEKMQEELSDVLEQTVKECESKNIHTIIWSNESFFGRMAKTLVVLKEFEKRGHEVQSIAYIRRHDAWARSAYIQWGLKHKTSEGKLQPFSQWIEKRMPHFSKGLQEVLNEFPHSFFIRNVDSLKDAVADFLTIFGLNDLNIIQIRDNDSPSNEELFLRALFNEKFDTQVLPKRFDNTVGKNIKFSVTASGYLNYLLPRQEDIYKILNICKHDREVIDKLLVEQEQEPIDVTPLNGKDNSANAERIIVALCDIVLQQSLRISRLEKLLNSNDTGAVK